MCPSLTPTADIGVRNESGSQMILPAMYLGVEEVKDCTFVTVRASKAKHMSVWERSILFFVTFPSRQTDRSGGQNLLD
jgi:hypothetical protein